MQKDPPRLQVSGRANSHMWLLARVQLLYTVQLLYSSCTVVMTACPVTCALRPVPCCAMLCCVVLWCRVLRMLCAAVQSMYWSTKQFCHSSFISMVPLSASCRNSSSSSGSGSISSRINSANQPTAVQREQQQQSLHQQQGQH